MPDEAPLEITIQQLAAQVAALTDNVTRLSDLQEKTLEMLARVADGVFAQDPVAPEHGIPDPPG